MEQYTQSTEVLNLGKKIVQEFSYHDRCDVTTRWMGHYLAELITNSENEPDPIKKASLQEKCADVILKLWERRDLFHENARPLSSFENLLSIINALKNEKNDSLQWRHYINREDSTTWGGFFKLVRESTEDILATAISVVLLKSQLAKEKEWLDHQDMLSDEEKAMIENLDELLSRTDTRIRFKFVSPDETNDETPEENNSMLNRAFEKINILLLSQMDALSELRRKSNG